MLFRAPKPHKIASKTVSSRVTRAICSLVARVSARSLRATYALSYASKKGCEGCSLALVYRVTQSLAELGKPHTAPPQNLQTTIMRSVGGLTTKTSTRTPRARAGSAPPNSKGSVVPYKPLFSDPRARLWPSDAFAVERSLLLNLRPVSCRRRRQVALRLDCRAAWRRLDCTGFERRRSTAALPATSSVVIIHLPSSRMHPRLRR